MIGLGTILNVITVLIGSSLGMIIGNRLPEKMQQTIIATLGLVTIVMGMGMALTTANILIPLFSLLVGGIVGEWIAIDRALQRFAAWLESRVMRNKGEGEESEDATRRFIRGFITASLVFCVGPMTIIGSINDGLKGDYQLLAIKSMLDGFASLAFASSLGIGVMFATLTIAIFQGLLTLFAAQASAILTDPCDVKVAQCECASSRRASVQARS